jgi:hypothetical protein
MSAIRLDDPLWDRVRRLSHRGKCALEARVNAARGLRMAAGADPIGDDELRRAGLLTDEGDIVPAYLDRIGGKT